MQPLLKRFPEQVRSSCRLSAGLEHRVAIASLLASSGDGQAVSGELLGSRLGISRAAVQKHVRQLRELGFPIVAAAGTGYRLESPFSDLVVAEAVLPYLLKCREGRWTGGILPWLAGVPYCYVKSCASTNAVLRQIADHSPSGTIVVTDEQTDGRGRLGRSWLSRPGKDLTFSLLARPAVAPARAHLVSLAAALAVAETLERLSDGPVGIKWPNDVLLGADKVCGILVEGSMDADSLRWAVVGIGINVNSEPAAFVERLTAEERRPWIGRPRPVSLRERLGRQVPRAPLFASLLDSLTSHLSALEEAAAATTGNTSPHGMPESGSLLDGIRRRDVLAGHHVDIFSGPGLDEPVVSGVATGIGPEGQLLVRTADGVIFPVFAGDATLRTRLRTPAAVNRCAHSG